MKTLPIILALAILVGSATPNDPLPIECKGAIYSGFTYHDCLEGLYITTSIWSGPCGEGCPYIINVTAEVKEECEGEHWQHVTLTGVLACGSQRHYTYTFNGDNVAWAHLVCTSCSVVVPVDPGETGDPGEH